MTSKRQAIIDQFRAAAQSCLNTAQDLETGAVLTLDPKGSKRFNEQAASYRRRADSFSKARGIGHLRPRLARAEPYPQGGWYQRAAYFARLPARWVALLAFPSSWPRQDLIGQIQKYSLSASFFIESQLVDG